MIPAISKWQAAQPGNRDGQMDAFVGMNSAQEDQLFAGRLLKRIQREIDPVVHGGQIVQSGARSESLMETKYPSRYF